ncbi:TIGR00341 family protein [Vibrio sp. WJH972]
MAQCLIIDKVVEEKSYDNYPISDQDIYTLVHWPQEASKAGEFEQWWVMVDDAYMPDVLNQAQIQRATLNILPHSNNPHTQRGFGLPSSLADVVWDSSQRSMLEWDLVRCNDNVVLNKVVIGQVFSFQPGGHKNQIWLRAKLAWRRFRQLNHPKNQPQLFTINCDCENPIVTAAIGVTCTPHVLGSNLSRKLLPDLYANDGQLYALVVSPKSVQQLILYLLALPLRSSVSQPGFLGVLRSNEFEVSSSQPMAYQIDERPLEADSIKLEIDEVKLNIAVDSDSLLLESVKIDKDVRRIHDIPQSKQAIQALVGKPLPWISHAADDDFKELYLQIRENAKVSASFLVMMVLSTLLASFGLYADSAPVIIGAMILAPLMAPIISLAMAFVRQDQKLLATSAKTLTIGWAVAIGFAMILSWILPMRIETHEISVRLSPTLLDLGVAIISGIAGAYAHAKSEAAKSLAGVAIAVALVPPLAVTGIGLGWASWHVATGGLLLFIANLTGIVFSAALTFLILGFAPFERARKGLILALFSVAIVSIPLGFSFVHLAQEAKVIRIVETMSLSQMSIRQVDVSSLDNPMKLSFELVSQRPLDQVDIRGLKDKIEKRLDKEVTLEIKSVLQY